MRGYQILTLDLDSERPLEDTIGFWTQMVPTLHPCRSK